MRKAVLRIFVSSCGSRDIIPELKRPYAKLITKVLMRRLGFSNRYKGCWEKYHGKDRNGIH